MTWFGRPEVHFPNSETQLSTVVVGVTTNTLFKAFLPALAACGARKVNKEV
jgi:hypothetical protein